MAAKVGLIWLSSVRGEYFQMSFVKISPKIEKNTCDICFIEMQLLEAHLVENVSLLDS